MEKTREELHKILCDDLGNNHCYYSPPSNIQMLYPCIVYERDGTTIRHADDTRYFNRKRYHITIITENEDDDILKNLIEDTRLLYLSEDSPFVTDGLYHYPYTLYF